VAQKPTLAASPRGPLNPVKSPRFFPQRTSQRPAIVLNSHRFRYVRHRKQRFISILLPAPSRKTLPLPTPGPNLHFADSSIRPCVIRYGGDLDRFGARRLISVETLILGRLLLYGVPAQGDYSIQQLF
jgi:hypothetical protein